MIKFLSILSLILLLSQYSFAQKKLDSTKSSQKSTVQSEAFPKSNLTRGFQKQSVQFSERSEPKKNKAQKEKSLLDVLYSIDDERLVIERDKGLSKSERSIRIDENKNRFGIAKRDFYSYVKSKGFLNLSRKEQGYYLMLLKKDGNIEEYKEMRSLK
jgi:hypothetical protein